MNPTPGWKTTEFWATLISQALSILALLGFVSPNDTGTLEESGNKVVAAIILFASNAAVVLYYVKSRFHLKANAQDATPNLVTDETKKEIDR